MKRQKLRKKETKRVLKEVEERTGVKIEGELERVEVAGRVVLLLNEEPVLLEHDGRHYFTVYGIMKFRPERGMVVVDEGAVKFVMNGADIMRPGIVEADSSIQEGDFCYVVVEKKLTPLAVGIALTSGEDMVGDRGKAVENIHHLNDKIWRFFFKRE
ncbi:RNA-binding protein, containing PUA domain [Geoglobus ahangari]|uniref:RNA-binding protein, containing PUA domain n=1 Tax=Geoglobus ahangari TaxID=113653 RepID=A0A0F7IFY7_9EURY|nr:RNA-binding protein [Geoglobus ahangari]AKG91449.1 RNA-binding protein, containing PUA domain [Geoglobus ahangari]